MKPTTRQMKAAALLQLDSHRKAHHRALSSLHASPLPDLTESHYEAAFLMRRAHETRGLAMWRKLRALEQLAHRGAEAYCNGERLNLRPGTSFDFRADEDAWMQFCECVKGEAMKVFGGIAPPGFYVNHDPRGYALKLDPDKATVPAGMEKDWGGYGILAADITM